MKAMILLASLFSISASATSLAPAQTYRCGALTHSGNSTMPVGGPTYFVELATGKVTLTKKFINPTVQPQTIVAKQISASKSIFKYAAGDINIKVNSIIQTKKTLVSIEMAGNPDWSATCTRQK